jgi:hypothetical protein
MESAPTTENNRMCAAQWLKAAATRELPDAELDGSFSVLVSRIT